MGIYDHFFLEGNRSQVIVGNVCLWKEGLTAGWNIININKYKYLFKINIEKKLQFYLQKSQ